MNNSPLILLGASIRAMANSAGNAGIATCGADLFADLDTQRLTQVAAVTQFPEELFQFAHNQPRSPWAYTGGLENFPRSVETLSKTHKLLGNNRNVLESVRDFGQVSTWAAQAGLRTPLQDQNIGMPRGKWLVKSAHSAGGHGVRWGQPGEILGIGERRERWVEGRTGSAAFLACRANNRLLGLSWQLPSPPSQPFAYAGSLVSAHRPTSDAVDSLVEFGRIASKETPICGLWGVDFIEDDYRNLAILEINPRWTASMEILERHARKSLLPLHIAACEGDESSLRDAEQFAQTLAFTKGAAGKQILYATEPRRASPAWNAWANTQNSTSGQPNVADIPPAGTAFYAGDPVCTLLHDDDSEARLRKELDRLQHEAWSRLAPPDSRGSDHPLG